MPQPKRAASSSSGSTSRRSTSARSSSRSAASKSTARSGSTRSGGARSTAAKSRSSSSGRTTKASSSRSSTGRSRSTAGTRSRSTAAGDARVEAVAARLRKLNERIIDAGRDAGESTLDSYEKALKAIATAIEKGPGRSDIEWISHLATTQAKFIRDVTNSWTKAARGVLK